jgi:two-component system, NtrC family, response regulator PilR
MKEYVKILVTDDEPLMRNLLLKILESEGYQVAMASSGAEALEHLQKEKFDLLLSDVKMPGISGFELLKKVKAEYQDMAVIMMTAYGEAFSIKQALIDGADEYITKPFKNHEISLIVERAYWRLLSTRNGGKLTDQILVDEPST